MGFGRCINFNARVAPKKNSAGVKAAKMEQIFHCTQALRTGVENTRRNLMKIASGREEKRSEWQIVSESSFIP